MKPFLIFKLPNPGPDSSNMPREEAAGGPQEKELTLPSLFSSRKLELQVTLPLESLGRELHNQ